MDSCSRGGILCALKVGRRGELVDFLPRKHFDPRAGGRRLLLPDQRSIHQTIGMLDATWTSLVEPHEEGTKLTIEVEYAPPGAVLGKLAEHLTVRRMSRDLHSSLLNLKDLLEG